MITKPMLSGKCNDSVRLPYPVLASPKLDGIRCLVLNGKVLSRSFKEIPNKYIRFMLENIPTGLDGEIMLRDKNASFQEITSAVMSVEGKPDFIFHVFDYVKDSLETPYIERMQHLFNLDVPSYVKKVLPKLITDHDKLERYEEEQLAAGFEGIMVRLLDGPYKCGRSTEREAFLLKIKRFKDGEATVLDFVPKMHNNNPLEKDEFGNAKRSSAKAGLVATAMLGTLKVVDIKTGIDFEVGTGFTDAMRKEIWENRHDYIGKTVKYKYQDVGVKNKPRIPVFLGFRDMRDQ